ncbi:MAG: ribonuclease activity regulator RraA [Acidobacteriia bacterium]|nr:ribonuclease activity regulator RraA [Methyloceanibacter sp.]MCL6490779.1 ribonuclease activity regulator RraA [Terriglobia bacterium]
MKEETRKRLQGVSTATLTTQLFKRGISNVFMCGVKPLTPAAPKLVGPAFTLRNIPARADLVKMEVLANPEYPQRKAIEMTPPGHVLVIDSRGEAGAGTVGDILAKRLQVRGVAGVVTDGGLRDTASLAELGFPLYCAAPAAPLSLALHYAVDLQVPIGCGGVAVFPGDVIVGDADGVVVIPQAIADDIAREAAEQEMLEQFLFQRIAEGAALPGTYPPDDETRAAFAAWRAQRAATNP